MAQHTGKIITLVAVLASLGAVSTVSAETRGARISFGEIDTNGDGQITQEEMAAIGQLRFNSIDTNNDGAITAEEIAVRMNATSASRAERLIERRDANNDGMLTLDEMGGNRAGRGFERIDSNSDGVVSEAEFAEAQS